MKAKTRDMCMLPTRGTTALKTSVAWKWGNGKGIRCKWKEKKSWGSNIISDKTDFKTKTVIRDKNGQYIMIEGSIQQEDITTVHIYVPNIGSPKYIKQILTDINGEIDSNTIPVGVFWVLFFI